MAPGRRTITKDEWMTEGQSLFGPNLMDWRFVCPGCGHVASAKDYEAAGAPSGAVGFSCIGRYLPACRDWLSGSGPGPCNYAGGGLFQIHPVGVIDGETTHPIFAFDTSGTTSGGNQS